MIAIQTDAGQIKLNGHPNECPFCHKSIMPIFLYGHKNKYSMEVNLICPNQDCYKSFISYYTSKGTHYDFIEQTTFGNPKNIYFSETIISISKNFTIIYNQTYTAEQQRLAEICGVGYRKALEFLIKEYIIFKKPDTRETVEKKPLGLCIAEYIEDSRIRSVAKRAVWLGNDETHYIKKWEGKNLDDLKRLIDLTVHWIEMESLTKEFEHEMQE
jgi:hypothetical protein